MMNEEIVVSKPSGGVVFLLAGLCAITLVTLLTCWSQKSEIAKLQKFKTDCDIAVPTMAQKLDALAAAHQQLIVDLRPIVSQQQSDMAVVARVMSDRYGKDAWVAMVTKANKGIARDTEANK